MPPWFHPCLFCRLQDVSARIRFGQKKHGRFGQKHGRFGQELWTFRPKKMDVSAKYIFNGFTETNDTHYRQQSFTYVACRLLRWQQQAEWQKTGINFAEKYRCLYIISSFWPKRPSLFYIFHDKINHRWDHKFIVRLTTEIINYDK